MGKKVHYIQQARSPSKRHHASVLPHPRLHEPGFPPPIGIRLTMIQHAEEINKEEKNIHENQTDETFQFNLIRPL